jgi:predicted anti-sigma-YlaC factor YlaD
MNCKEAIERLADYLEARLTQATLDQLEAHLRTCEPCRAYLATYERTAKLAAKANSVEMPPEMKRRLLSFLSGISRTS